MESHKRILGILYIISGSLQFIIIFLLSLFLSTILSFVVPELDPHETKIVEFVVSILQVLPAIIIILFAILSIIGGIGLLNKQQWAMILTLILGCFKLFSFPIGTALGVYTIWVYAEDQKLKKQTA